MTVLMAPEPMAAGRFGCCGMYRLHMHLPIFSHECLMSAPQRGLPAGAVTRPSALYRLPAEAAGRLTGQALQANPPMMNLRRSS